MTDPIRRGSPHLTITVHHGDYKPVEVHVEHGSVPTQACRVVCRALGLPVTGRYQLHHPNQTEPLHPGHTFRQHGVANGDVLHMQATPP